MKHPYYYPILTDSFAFLLGAAMLWAYLRQRKWILAAVALIGAFTFPSIVIMALPLLVFNEKGSGHYPTVPTDQVLIVLLLLMIAALALLGPAFYGLMPFGTMQPSRLMVLVSLPFVLLYVDGLVVGCGHSAAASRLHCGHGQKGSGTLGRMLFIAVVALKLWTKPSPFTFSYFALHSVAYGVVHPAVWLVAHVIYFGPVFLLMLFFWKQVKQTLLRLPLPLFWCMMFTFMLTIRSESRTLIAGLPFILYIMVLAMKDVPLKAWQQAAMLMVAVATLQGLVPYKRRSDDGRFPPIPDAALFHAHRAVDVGGGLRHQWGNGGGCGRCGLGHHAALEAPFWYFTKRLNHTARDRRKMMGNMMRMARPLSPMNHTASKCQSTLMATNIATLSAMVSA
jgi:hypothetical protein